MNKAQRKHFDAVSEDIIQKMVFLKIELGQMQLFKTMNKIDEALKEVGWECAEKITGKKRKIKAEDR